MKVKVEELAKSELINLFSTATYGSEWLSIHTLKSEQHLDPYNKEGRCCEEKWADRLLAGGHIICVDHYDEDEDGEEGKVYKVDLEMIYKGVALDLECNNNWGKVQCGEGDIYNAESVIQYILFGELVYG